MKILSKYPSEKDFVRSYVVCRCYLIPCDAALSLIDLRSLLFNLVLCEAALSLIDLRRGTQSVHDTAPEEHNFLTMCI